MDHLEPYRKFGQLIGKEAARRTTSRSKTIKVFKPEGPKNLRDAFKDEKKDARQSPWTYGERRKGFGEHPSSHP